MVSYSIDDSLIDSLELVKRRSWYFRLDVMPFSVAYIISLALFWSQPFKTIGMVVTPLVLAVQIVVFIVSQFSISVKSKLGYEAAKSAKQADYVLVKAAKNCGKDRIVELFHRDCARSVSVADYRFSSSTTHFEFQKVHYNYNSDSDTFIRRRYPASGTIVNYCSSTGLKSDGDVVSALQIWGRNDFDIPIPDFLDIYAEHLVAPFFVFQVLCLLLWSLDDYWYYSVFTLVMLMGFEGALAKQRLNSLQMLREMRREATRVYVYRCGRWSQISSEALIPGDVISLHSKTGGITRFGTSREQTVPCDAVLIRGSCVVNEAMLTGESVPQVKESLRLASAEDVNETKLVNFDNGDGQLADQWKRHMIYSGTVISQYSESLADEEAMVRASGKGFSVPRAPDMGCQAVVIRTGFGTSQGGLMRKILFANERVSTNSNETFLFIGCLMVFAIISSTVVLQAGLQDESRNQFKLILHCIMIITSVVPPELPMELSLAVTTSLAALAKSLVYCTEPFRIPLAGQVNVLCFDKTGTLTQDTMNLRGVVDPQPVAVVDELMDTLSDDVEDVSSANTALEAPEECNNGILTIMASCQSLIYSSDTGVLGDPLEVESFKNSGFEVNSTTASVTSISHPSRGVSVRTLHKYPFSSSLKRMSVVVDVKSSRKTSTFTRFVYTKGAPEVVQSFLSEVPNNFEATYLHHMSKGRRVIALAYKVLSDDSTSSVSGHTLSRASVECDLKFAGFLVFDSALKSDTKGVMKDLRGTGVSIIMITGDSAYTAADVSRKLFIIPKEKPLLILEAIPVLDGACEKQHCVAWKRVHLGNKEDGKENSERIYFDPVNVAVLSQEHSLCVTGSALQALESFRYQEFSYAALMKLLCPCVKVFARVSPDQKEKVLVALNDSGLCTLMCGDGTNDVGALKAAHVGVSVINDPELEKRVEKVSSSDAKKKKQKSSSRDRAARALAEIEQQQTDPTIVQLGDASIASPFTARRTSIDSVLTVLRQGRCSQVTTIQVYKILALNCLVSAYMMSSLYLRGLKQGDMQMTASGLATAGLFFFISRAKPLPKLSYQKPPCSVFTVSVMGSIVGQFLTHFLSLLAVLYLCDSYDIHTDASKPIPDSRFQPNLFNSSIYILSTTIMINNFIVNYRGNPFTESIWDNTYLCRSLQFIYAVIALLVSDIFEPLSDYLQLVHFPSIEFQYMLGLILVSNLLVAYGIEKFFQRFES